MRATIVPHRCAGCASVCWVFILRHRGPQRPHRTVTLARGMMPSMFP